MANYLQSLTPISAALNGCGEGKKGDEVQRGLRQFARVSALLKPACYFLSGIDFGRFNDKTSVPGVNRNQVHALRVGAAPLQEQRQIASCLSSIEKKIEVEEKRKTAPQALFKTMLHHLMTGKIRVKGL